MPTIARSQENTTDIINWFLTLGGEKFDAALVEFRIMDITSGLPGTQVFPAVDGTYEDVTASPGRFALGSYYAYDNTAGTGWTPAVDANLGTHRIEWRWKDTLTSDYSTGYEDFTVSSGSGGQAYDLYVTLNYLRSIGLPTPPSDADVNEAILLWQSFIERVTNQWYYPRSLELFVDGTGGDILHFGVPIIEIEEVEINLGIEGTSGSGLLLESTDYRVYNRTGLDDKTNPRIALYDQLAASRDIFTSFDRTYRRKFQHGRQNQRIKGTFGYVEADGSCPPMIKRALTLIIIEKLSQPPIATGTSLLPPVMTGVISEEWSDGHKVKYETTSYKPTSSGLSDIITNTEARMILKLFKAPIGIASPNHLTI